MYTTEYQLEIAKRKLKFIEMWLEAQGENLEINYKDMKSANIQYMNAELVRNIRWQNLEEFESMYNEVMQFDRLKNYK